MKTFRSIVFIGIIGLLVSSCGSKKKTLAKDENKEKNTVKEVVVKESEHNPELSKPTGMKDISTEKYIKTYAPIAMTQMKLYSIPASITLAQGILESRSGNSDLTKVSNNHFGIKCHKDWEGNRTYYDDDKKQECFRVYDDPDKSFDDHAMFLVHKKRYAGLFKLKPGDYKAWAKGLRKAGYATDKHYPEKLIQIIEKYELYKYDESVLKNRQTHPERVVSSPDPHDNSPINAASYIVQKGDGLYSISKRSGVSIADIKRYNNLHSDDIKIGQILLLKVPEKEVVRAVSNISNPKLKVAKDTLPPAAKDSLQPVQTKETAPSEKQMTNSVKKPDFHIVEQSETLYQIAYKYELEVPDLRRWNHIRKNEIRVGQRLFLRDPREIYAAKKTRKSIPEVSESQPSDSDVHIVAPKETLYSISRMYGLSVKKLMQLNGLTNYTIRIGQALRVR